MRLVRRGRSTPPQMKTKTRVRAYTVRSGVVSLLASCCGAAPSYSSRGARPGAEPYDNAPAPISDAAIGFASVSVCFSFDSCDDERTVATNVAVPQ